MLEVHDKGYYKCEASNGAATVETTAILFVKEPKWGGMNAPADIPHFPPVFANSHGGFG